MSEEAKGARLANTQVEYASHDQPARIRSLIETAAPGTRVVVVGHSWGADTAAQIVDRLAREGRPIDMLVTVDPVGPFLSDDFFRRVRAGAREWINVNAADRNPSNPSNQIAELGGQYGQRPQRFASQHFDAPFAHGDFEAMIKRILPDGRNTLYERILGR
ncbi:alpha/beta hydrolase [Roseomonas sp. HJA6]|uniref:Alpha/beta hydrolase n=1 Tax=Roseomonas alba TaxID=2846776 RepID=A0ABS7A8Q4_9PROT|nr:alpha/beta hydrolase [Neoroseomonas alba]MBW6398701.1 alpha/beta hydrolase [Neoroseomonas alba]